MMICFNLSDSAAIVLIGMLLFSGCKKKEVVLVPDYPWPNETWTGKSPGDLGMDGTKIAQLNTAIEAGTYGNIHSLLIVKDGYLAFEKYYNDSFKEEAHDLQSATKSIASLLTGIAVDKGYFHENDSVLNLIKSSYLVDTDVQRKKITVKDILTMRHGIDWREWGYSSSDQDNMIMANRTDWLQYVLDRPMDSDPGTSFNYSTGASVFISAIIDHKTSISTEEFADQFLFSRIGISSQDWWIRDQQQLVHTGGGLKMKSQDLARLGLLILHNGKWDDESLVSSSWLSKSFTPYTENALLLNINGETQNLHYGFHWWIIPVEYNGEIHMVKTAMGTGGQFIFVIEKYNLVVVSTAWNVIDSAQASPVGWIKKYILPSIN